MAKSFGAGKVYVLATLNGVCKVGFTTGDPIRRRYAGSRLGLEGCTVVGDWEHERAFVVERFVHMYLQAKQVEGEWYRVSGRTAARAVKRAITFIHPPEFLPKDWLGRSGMSEQEAVDFFSTMPGAVEGQSFADVQARFLDSYWTRQHATWHKRPRHFPHTTSEQSEQYYSQRSAAAARANAKRKEAQGT